MPVHDHPLSAFDGTQYSSSCVVVTNLHMS